MGRMEDNHFGEEDMGQIIQCLLAHGQVTEIFEMDLEGFEQGSDMFSLLFKACYHFYQGDFHCQVANGF